jgi:hypothetical protein
MTVAMLAATALSTQEVISSMVVTIGQGCRILAQTRGHGSSSGLKYLWEKFGLRRDKDF